MYQYLKQYINRIDTLLIDHKLIKDSVIEQHLIKIKFFQHERQIHLFVTIAYALFLLISMFFLLVHPIFVIIPILLLCFLTCYVIHYFRLENGVQYLYKQYDQMLEKQK